MHKWLYLILLFSFSTFAQELPEHLSVMLGKSQDYFKIYNQKTAAEIDDGIYDESEYYLFSQIDQIQGLCIMFSKREIKNAKIKMVELIAQTFETEQLQAISKVGRSAELNKKQAAIFFEVALEYKLGKITDITFPSRQ